MSYVHMMYYFIFILNFLSPFPSLYPLPSSPSSPLHLPLSLSLPLHSQSSSFPSLAFLPLLASHAKPNGAEHFWYHLAGCVGSVFNYVMHGQLLTAM